MKRILVTLMWLVVAAPASPAEGDFMWGCAPFGQRQKVLFLADRGSRSYVKLSGQRVNATVSRTDAEIRWTFGANAVVLTSELVAEYHERGTLKAKFKCKVMTGGDS
jgi:hypothetical protein